MNKYNQTFAYSFRERTLKRGLVYDIIFRIVDEKGKEVQKAFCGFSTKTKAKQAYNDFMSTYIAVPKKVNVKGHLLYDELMPQYLAFCLPLLKDATFYLKRGQFNLFITPYFKSKKMSFFTKANLYEWQDWLWQQKHGIKPNDNKPYVYTYLIKVRQNLAGFLEWCSERYNTPNEMPLVKAPKRQIPQKAMLFWDKNEFDIYIETVDNLQWRTLFSFLYYTGCRIGEALSLQESDCKNKSIYVSKSLTKKTLDGSSYKITSTKNNKVRTVPIPQKLSVQLDEYLAWKRETKQSKLFLFGDGTPLPQTTIRRVFSLYTSKANLERIRIHDLRHSYVSLLVHLGANMAVVADLIGDTLEQVVKTYAHMYEADKVQLVAEIDKI